MDTNKIMVLSDAHGNAFNLSKTSKVMKECDYVFYLGDFVHDIEPYKKILGDKLIIVKGNCDGYLDCESEKIIEIGKTRFFLTHGHNYGVKFSLLRLSLKAKEVGADFVFYGHTHISNIELYEGVTLVNPGSIGSSRQNNASYAIIQGKENNFFAEIVII